MAAESRSERPATARLLARSLVSLLFKLLLGGIIVWGFDAALLASPTLMAAVGQVAPKVPVVMILLALGWILAGSAHRWLIRDEKRYPYAPAWANNEWLLFAGG